MVMLTVLNSELNHFTKYSYFYKFLSVDCSCIIVLLLKIVIECAMSPSLSGTTMEFAINLSWVPQNVGDGGFG
jgi:hypothetical protein